MLSTFHGLETARRAMTTQQYALQTMGHNVANANTPGYSRQRVNFAQTETFPAPAMNRPQLPGFLGTGVKAESIQRIRDQFLDIQFRNENNKNGYYQTTNEALSKIEDILNEPSEVSLSFTMEQFWQSLQDLSVNPQDPGARAVVRQRGVAVAETFRYTAESLNTIRRDYEIQIANQQKEMNSILEQINSINKQIGEAEPHGYVTNELYDERDVLLDRLSSFVNIKTERVASGGAPSPVAEGKLTVYMYDGNGQRINLVDGSNFNELKQFQVQRDGEFVSGITIFNQATPADGPITLNVENFGSKGSFIATIESFGYYDGDVVKGHYPSILANLDEMAHVYATEFNRVHEAGWSPNGTGISFFQDLGNATLTKEGFASRIAVSQAIINSTDNIAAATFDANGNAFIGDGSNARNLANVKDTQMMFAGRTANVQSFYRGIIGDLAVDISEAKRLANNTAVLRENVDSRRDAMSNVSIDEELTNMIKFQHAYNAAARNITLVDEMLDRIINGMGLAGR